MPFDIAYWKEAVKAYLPQAKDDFKRGVYTTLSAASFLPLLLAYQDPASTGPALMALWNILSGLGSNILANKLQTWAASETPDLDTLAVHLQETIDENALVRKELDAVLKTLETVDQANVELNEKDRAWFQETLQQELNQLNSNLRIIYTDSYFEKLILHNGDFVARDKVTYIEKQEIYHPTSDPLALDRAQAETVRQAYLYQLYLQCQDLPLDKFGEADTQAARVKLDDVYIELFTTTPKDTEKIEEEKEQSFSLSKENNLLTAWEAVQRSNLLVILGDPGSGKSSFAKRLLGRLCLAEMGQIPRLEGFAKGLTPVLINLRDLVPDLQKDTLPENTRARKSALRDLILNRAAQDVISEHRTPAFEDGIRQAILCGECFLVLDGFDEVPQALRGVVREAVAAILSFNPQRVLVTCRIRSYTGEAVLSAFDAYTLASLDKNQIIKFCYDWYHRMSELKRILQAEYENKAEDFFKAVTSDEKLQELAGNPMLLTTMAIVHQKNIHLPTEKVKLFQEVVKILLFRWQKYHGNIHIKGNLRQLLTNEGKLLRAIEHLAYAAHQVGQGDTEGKNAADLPRKLARDMLEDYHLESSQLAEEFLDYIDQRSGILIGRGGELGKPHTYAFPHRFLQEYLAGCHLASIENPYERADQFCAIAEEGDFWDEAALLAFEELRHNRTSSSLWSLAVELVQDCDLKNPCHQRQVMWSGQIANLIGRKTLEEGGRRGSRYLDNLESKLLTAAQGTLLSPLERAETADALDGLGYTPEDLYTFIEIPGGDMLSNFWMGKYPVTNEQYARFLTPENFTDPSLWMDLPDLNAKGQHQGTLGDRGWCWLKSEIQAKDVLTPRYWNSLRFGKNRPCAPVVGVSWYEAMAYARWVQHQWDQLQEAIQNQGIKPGLIRLPVEVEWEIAAGGTANDRYAWDAPGETTDRERLTKCANTDESGIGRTTPVWTYPQGQSFPYGLFDMTGNVWEWQANRKTKSGSRELRGGSFHFYHSLARCAHRYGHYIFFRRDDIGFRLCLLP